VLASSHPRPTRSAIIDLVVVTAVVWGSVLLTRNLGLPEVLDTWNENHQQWAIDEVTLISLFTALALGAFSWRRWRESQRIVARHVATLERLRTTELEIASKDQLIRSVSHELRTPLTAILGYAELLGEEPGESSDRASMVATIIRQGRDLTHIVEDLMTRAQSEAQTLQVAAVPIHLTAQAHQVLETWDPDGVAEVRLLTEVPVRAVGDPARVRQVLRNLVSNALNYGGAQVEIEVGVGESTAWITVSDDGDGVGPGEEEWIFDPYRRAGTSRREPAGLGLGLSISRRLAHMMGGDLVYRREGGRTVFELSLPRLVEDHRA
jgi:signal transduction histidine kinase